MIRKQYKNVKKCLKKSRLVNYFTLGKYSFSPYVACEHGCLYCDGRSEKYFVSGDFEKDIIIRPNLPDLLGSELKKIREPGLISIGSGVSDPYQSVEKGEAIMTKCLKRIRDNSRLGVSVMTKSNLILRDIDICEKIHEKSGVILMVSLTSLDENIRQILEPSAPSFSERVELLREFKSRGMYTGVLALPLIYGITDNFKQLESLYEVLKEIDVDFIYPGGLTLRPGVQKDIFFDTIKKNYPDLLHEFQRRYSNNLSSGSPVKSSTNELYNNLKHLSDKYQIPIEPPHYMYKDLYPVYDEIYILLNHMVSLYSANGTDTLNLKKALNAYSVYLDNEKKTFNRRRKIPYKEFEERFLKNIGSDEFAELINNHKLHTFIKVIVEKRQTFDYLKLKLV